MFVNGAELAKNVTLWQWLVSSKNVLKVEY